MLLENTVWFLIVFIASGREYSQLSTVKSSRMEGKSKYELASSHFDTLISSIRIAYLNLLIELTFKRQKMLVTIVNVSIQFYLGLDLYLSSPFITIALYTLTTSKYA